MRETLTLEQAYKTMVVFLGNYNARKGRRDELEILLGDIQLLSDVLKDPAKERDETGLLTVDPASWFDWLEAAETVLGNDATNQER